VEELKSVVRLNELDKWQRYSPNRSGTCADQITLNFDHTAIDTGSMRKLPLAGKRQRSEVTVMGSHSMLPNGRVVEVFLWPVFTICNPTPITTAVSEQFSAVPSADCKILSE
jgi:hypothetical protein